MEDGIFVSDREGDFSARGEAPHPSFFEFQGLALCYTAPGVRDVACSLRVRLADWPSLARSLPLSLAFSLPQMYYLHGDGMRRLGRPAPVQRSAAGSISPHLVRGAGLQDSTVVRTAQAAPKAFMAHFRASEGGVAGACPSPDGSGSEASRIDLAAALREVEALNDEVEGGVRPPDGGLCPVALLFPRCSTLVPARPSLPAPPPGRPPLGLYKSLSTP